MKKFSKEWWKEFLKTSSVRALWTFSESIVGLTSCSGMDLLKLNWGEILLVSLIIAILSYPKSFIIGVPEMELNNYKVKEIK